MQWFSDNGNKEQINQYHTGKAADENSHERSPSPLQVHHFRKRKPFSRGAGKKALKQQVIDKPDPKKEPAKIMGFVPPIHHIPVPAAKAEIRNGENDQCIDKEIQGTGAFANCFHRAKIVSGE